MPASIARPTPARTGRGYRRPPTISVSRWRRIRARSKPPGSYRPSRMRFGCRATARSASRERTMAGKVGRSCVTVYRSATLTISSTGTAWTLTAAANGWLWARPPARSGPARTAGEVGSSSTRICRRFTPCGLFRWSPALNINHHSVFGGLVFKFAAAGEHVITHMREDEPFRPNLIEVSLQQTQRHVRGDRLVARIGLADEEIGVASDLDQPLRPLRVAGISDHLAFEFDPQTEARSGAFVVQHPKRCDAHVADVVALADLELAQRDRKRPLHRLGTGKGVFHQSRVAGF